MSTRVLAATALCWALLVVLAFGVRYSRVRWEGTVAGRALMALTVCVFSVGIISLALRVVDVYAPEWVPLIRVIFAIAWIGVGTVFFTLLREFGRAQRSGLRRRKDKS